MEGRRVLRSLTLKNILSFGPEGQTLELEPLNVLIGPNGSGKTNLIEVLGLLRSLPVNLPLFLSKAGGINEWLWKGQGVDPCLTISSEWERGTERPLLHSLTLRADGFMPRVVGEEVRPCLSAETIGLKHGKALKEVCYRYSIFEDGPHVKVPKGLKTDQSVLAQRREPDTPEIDDLKDRLTEIRFYRDWTLGPHSPIRATQPANLPGGFLEEDASNLALILNTQSLDRRVKESLLDNFRKVYQGANDIRVNIVGGYVELVVTEEHGWSIPAVRLSDGTLRYLCLLAILCHPSPPPLVCIEEPELGLHPDLIATVAKLLIDASSRTQLIVTTHSVDLISALWEYPEAVVVCERGFNGTTMERLDPKRLKKWLERFSLGELWTMGEIGGNRW